MFSAVLFVLFNLCQRLCVTGQKNEEQECDNEDTKVCNSILIEPHDELELHGTEFAKDANMGNENDGETIDIKDVMTQIITPANDHSRGACIDSRAQRKVICKQQAELYAQFADVNIAHSVSKNV